MKTRQLLLSLTLTLGACAPSYFLEPEGFAAFEAAGPVAPELDESALLRGIGAPGPYRVAEGDLLEVNAPSALFDPAGAVGPGESHWARVDSGGNIQLPLDVTIAAAGKTLVEIEQAITEAVYPRYVVSRPSIVVRVVDHRRIAVNVLGAVEEPGVHELRSDQMTLYGSLSAAGGILKSNNLVVGASMIRVRKAGVDSSEDVVLPVKGLNIPFSNMALSGGETIEVVRYEPDIFTVVGLVQEPGAFDYPPEVRYNLMQALAFAGGVDTFADPPYATIFRQGADGQIVPATFEIKGDGLADASHLKIKPGDVIAVQHTPATWTRSLIREVFQVRYIFGSTERD